MKLEFSKLIVIGLLLNGIAWTWCSYLLAYLGRGEIAETLSKTVVVEILGVLLVYSLKALFENLSKNNQWPDRVKTCEDSSETAPEDQYGPPS
jgi:hypothetical protein